MLIAPFFVGLWILGFNIYGTYKAWFEYGGGRPKSPLYGIWDVDQMSTEGQLRSPLTTYDGRWRRVIFDSPKAVSFQRMDGSVVSFGARINTEHKMVALTKASDKKWEANLSFTRTGVDELTLDGDLDSRKMNLRLKLYDRNKFMLVNRGFHWVQEYPFNR